MVPDIAHLLEQFRLPLQLEEARSFLHLTHSVTNYLDLYQEYFPKEYEHSMALIESGKAQLFPLRGEGYSPHEVRFLTLVDEHLFPLPLWWVVDDASDETRAYTTIPVEPIGIDIGYGDEIEDLRLGLQLLYYLVGEVPADIFDEIIETPDNAIFELPIEQGRVDGPLLKTRCEHAEEPLSFFYLAIDYMAHDTGTVWLDATHDMPCEDADWSRETINALVEQYAKAQDILDKTDRFLDWLEADVLNNFPEVRNIWNAAIRDTQAKERGR